VRSNGKSEENPSCLSDYLQNLEVLQLRVREAGRHIGVSEKQIDEI
jgi:hypothetical protein